MPSPENKPEIHASNIEATVMPGKVEDDRNTVLVNRSEGGVLFVRALHGEQSIVSVAITPDNDVHVAFTDGTTIFHPGKTPHEPSPLPLQAETAKEKEATLTLSGVYEKTLEYKQVRLPSKQKGGAKELHWLYKFTMRLPDTQADDPSQIVVSMKESAERQKKMNLQPGEAITVKGKMQHRRDTQTQQETEELFAFSVRREKPLDQPLDA